MLMSLTYIPFEATLPAGTGVQITEPCPTGVINSVQIHWPAGCNGLVGVSVVLGGRQILPQFGAAPLALDDTTPVYPLNLKKERYTDDLRVDMFNGDGAFAHHIVVVVGVEEDINK